MAVRSLTAVVLFLIVAALAVGAHSPLGRALSTGEVQGDVNCSGTADSIDSLQILRSVAGLNTTAACLDTAGDVNCDGNVNSIDSLRILRFVAGLGNSVPPACTPIGDPLGPPPSSFDLIEAALAGGDIDDEEALVYKLYATFMDTRLPDEYRGDDSGGPADSDALMAAASRYGSVSPATQALLAPFLIPPIYEGSWLASGSGAASAKSALVLPACPGTHVDWRCVDGATASVRVWWQTRYPGDQAQAEAVANALDSTIWTELTGLMGQPLSDAGNTYDGGSGAVDIYLVDAVRSAAPAHSSPGCKKTPAYIDLARTASMSVVAHEFMHVLQWTFDVKTGCMYQAGGDYNWLAEATATWAQDFVYPDGNEEHYIADWYMEKPDLPLETANDKHEYGAYLFFLHLTEFYGQEQIIRTVWDNTMQYGSLEAVDRSLPGGFAERWPGFAGCLWNQAPVDCFGQTDGLAQGAHAFVKPVDVELGGQPTRSVPVDGEVEHLAATFQWFRFTDNEIRSVVFENALAGLPHATVEALAKIDGQWQGPSDWTGQGTASYCRDVDGQQIQELVILIANSDWENQGKLLPPQQPLLKVSDVGCADWIGTAKADVYWSTVPAVVFKVEVSGLRFSHYETAGSEARYALVESSSARWRASGPNGICTMSGEMNLDPADPFSDYQGEVKGDLILNLQTQSYRADIYGYDPDAIVRMTCPDGFVDDEPWPYLRILEDGNIDHQATADGRLVSEWSTDQWLYSGTWKWHLDPAPPE